MRRFAISLHQARQTALGFFVAGHSAASFRSLVDEHYVGLSAQRLLHAWARL
jgi:hypothetical protein